MYKHPKKIHAEPLWGPSHACGNWHQEERIFKIADPNVFWLGMHIFFFGNHAYLERIELLGLPLASRIPCHGIERDTNLTKSDYIGIMSHYEIQRNDSQEKGKAVLSNLAVQYIGRWLATPSILPKRLC